MQLIDVVSHVKNSEFIAISYDESYKIAQRQQMDIIVRFWRNGEIESRYLKSCFLTEAKAKDLLNSFKTAVADLGI